MSLILKKANMGVKTHLNYSLNFFCTLLHKEPKYAN